VPDLKPLIGQPINSNVCWAACKNNQALPWPEPAYSGSKQGMQEPPIPVLPRGDMAEISARAGAGTKYNETFELFNGKYEALGIYPGWHFQVATGSEGTDRRESGEWCARSEGLRSPAYAVRRTHREGGALPRGRCDAKSLRHHGAGAVTRRRDLEGAGHRVGNVEI